MSVIDFFKNMASQAGQKLGGIAGRQQSTLDKQRSLDEVEAYFEQMAADGVIDPEEVDRLKNMLRAQGLDSTKIDALYAELQDGDGIVTAEEASGLGTELRGMLMGARADVSEDQALLQLELQQASNDYTLAINAASTLSKKEHDAYMAVIRNIGG